MEINFKLLEIALYNPFGNKFGNNSIIDLLILKTHFLESGL